jgi:23S rRNA (guanosine2251-2'-O)-methyltransferase
VVLGSEGRGLRRGVDQVLDHRVKIPMGGRVGSLNVSAAAAVMLFELQRRSRLATSS